MKMTKFQEKNFSADNKGATEFKTHHALSDCFSFHLFHAISWCFVCFYAANDCGEECAIANAEINCFDGVLIYLKASGHLRSPISLRT